MTIRLGALSVLLAALSLGAAAQQNEYRIAPASDTKFELVVAKTGLLSGKKHIFSFPQYSGELRYDAKAPEDAKVSLAIDASSIECKDDWVSDKDRRKILDEATGNMLQVKQHNTLRFESTSIRKEADGSFAVKGMLSLRGMPKPVDVKVKMTPAADGSIRFVGESTVDMTVWGMKPPKAVLGAIGTEKQMLVHFEVVAKK